ncbi:hypothetical protein F4778DRAFT_44750 [Xylariomycetidae sp. FL2044]|nr:hypothetical protein F4778DRAFT_44750 [Xylariomycetidae sp. FL2044]
MTPKTYLLDLATEIRLSIYSSLLIGSEPVSLETGRSFESPLLKLGPRGELYPAVLRVNKQIYSEAVSILYTGNRFEFPDLSYFDEYELPFRSISRFTKQIGTNGDFIRHIIVNFRIPQFDVKHEGRHRNSVIAKMNSLANGDMGRIGLIRSAFPNITTVEFSITNFRNALSNYYELNPNLADEAFEKLDTQLRRITSLRSVIVSAQLHEDQNVGPPHDGLREEEKDRRRKERNVLEKWREYLEGYGWIVNITVKSTWISSDARLHIGDVRFFHGR